MSPVQEILEASGQQRLSVDFGRPLSKLIDEKERAGSGGAKGKRHLVHVDHEGREAEGHGLDRLNSSADLD
jgi:hypothetical protein